MMVNQVVDITVPANDEVIVPQGSELLAAQGLTATVRLNYDTAPFTDPHGPPVQFVADILVAAGQEIQVERDVACINFPNEIGSRTTSRT